jgi:hypothetical protein
MPTTRFFNWLRARSEQLTAWYTDLEKGSKLLVLALVALMAFLFLPPVIRLLPELGGFTPDTLNAYTLGAAQYFLAITMAYVSWRWLFPGLYAYAAETMEGKLLESITNDLLALFSNETITLPELAERRKIATLQFLIRCVRFLYSVSPFVFFFMGSNAALTSALTAVPAAAPAL